MIWRVGLLFLSLFIFGAWGGWNDSSSVQSPAQGHPVNAACVGCDTVLAQIEATKREGVATSERLEKEQNALKALGPNDDAKRMQMTSTVFVLVAKVETLQNREIAKKKDLEGRCRLCSKGTKTSKVN